MIPKPFSLKNYFLKLAHYNHWANQIIYAELNNLNDVQLYQSCGAFFDSIIKTANHLWVGDTLWLGRILGKQASPYQLDSFVYTSILELTQAREKLDLQIIEMLNSKSEQDILGQVSYFRWGEPLTENLFDVLTHLFNHQTHHRGQLHSMVYQLTGVSMAQDLIIFQRLSKD